MIRMLSRFLFFFSSYSILPPPRKIQIDIIDEMKMRHQSSHDFIKSSLAQYDCQSKFFLKSVWCLFNVVSIVFFPLLLLVLLIRSLGLGRGIKKTEISDISLYPKIPLEIKNKFAPSFIKKPIGFLKPRDLKYVINISFKSGFRPYFIFRSIWKVAIYSEIIETYSPKRVWVTQEMVFESSLLTKYLSDFSIEHINYQHGDNYFSIQVAFCTFSQFYVWDSYYADLFKSLKADVGEYHLFSALDRLTSNYKPRNILKYYSQESESQEDFILVLNNLLNYSKKNHCDLVVRLHPLHKKDFEIETLEKFEIELESNSVDLIDSIYESQYICSEFSSVLYQASLLKKKIVVDNSFVERFEIIKDLNVIFLTKLEHELLVTA